ncbi:autophagy-related protein-like protein 7 [Bisporella sp. PMI_857]|nr:autophagy-related protein-like protein 7 [Bisporella sp. PMI_857]
MALKFAPWISEIELPFYTSLSHIKIDHDKLDDSARVVLGIYEPRAAEAPENSTRMRILGNALTSQGAPKDYIRAEGKIKNVNTIEDFKDADKTAMINLSGKQIWDAIQDGTIYSIPSLLSSFTILSFANLKKYVFTYWFAFPALHSDPAWKIVGPEPGKNRLTSEETEVLEDRVATWRYANDQRQHGFFLVKRVHRAADEDARPVTPRTPGDEDRLPKLDFEWVVGTLGDFETGFFDGIPFEDQFVSFVDPSTYEENPGWMLRNLLVLIRYRYKLSKVQILRYRDVHAMRHEPRSQIMILEAPGPVPEVTEMPKVTGWERHSNGKLTARRTDLAPYMDPQQLADQSVDLNLKLMKWRIAPDLDLEKIKRTKCLLLGAGTLGTFVSRGLMAWGVRKITFIDNATVSYSNPVRQPLFDHKDCLNGGAKKAFRAAEALQEIYPGVDSEGHVMSVPMLGHAITDESKTKADFAKLQKLIDEHDVIFLLMDTRESRWLPTVMGKAAGKIVMNAALGFDTYVVMRHGVTPLDGGEASLGCYFCNDVVAPGDSVKDQTLDQQCTVTRPGIAPIASALLVETLVSILQHPLGALAPAPKSTSTSASSAPQYERDPPNHPLGVIPHQIRGYLSTFNNHLISGVAYDKCSACSKNIIDAYLENTPSETNDSTKDPEPAPASPDPKGWKFIKRALSDKEYISELSGLAEVQRQAEKLASELDWDSEGADMDGGDGELL